MGKTLYKKFVVTASDYDASKPHLKADGYRDGQMLKAGLSMCMTAEGRKEVRRKDALGQFVTVTLTEHLVDNQGHECDASGNIIEGKENPDAHNFTILKRGFLEVTGELALRAPQVFIPEYDETKVRWILKATSEKAIAAKANSAADEMERKAKSLRAVAEAVKADAARRQKEREDAETREADLKFAKEVAESKAAEAETAREEAAKAVEENRKLKEQIAALKSKEKSDKSEKAKE